MGYCSSRHLLSDVYEDVTLCDCPQLPACSPRQKIRNHHWPRDQRELYREMKIEGFPDCRRNPQTASKRSKRVPGLRRLTSGDPKQSSLENPETALLQIKDLKHRTGFGRKMRRTRGLVHRRFGNIRRNSAGTACSSTRSMLEPCRQELDTQLTSFPSEVEKRSGRCECPRYSKSLPEHRH